MSERFPYDLTLHKTADLTNAWQVRIVIKYGTTPPPANSSIWKFGMNDFSLAEENPFPFGRMQAWIEDNIDSYVYINPHGCLFAFDTEEEACYFMLYWK
jgi:hypothetical protein